MIPRRFFWLFDAFVLGVAFLMAYWSLPPAQEFYAFIGLLNLPWIAEIVSPPAWGGHLPPLQEFLWILGVTAPIAVLTLGLLGGHHALLKQSRTRIFATSFAAPVIALSLVSLALFAAKNPGASRMLSFSYVLFSFIGLSLYRIVFQRYFFFRRDAGYYATNVLLAGMPVSIDWMEHYFAENVPTADYRLFGYLCVLPDVPSSKQCQDCDKVNKGKLTRLGNARELGDLLMRYPIQEVIAIQPISDGNWLKSVIQDCDYLGVLLRIVPEALLFDNRRALKTLYPFEPLHLPAVVLAPPNWDSESLFFKRLFDLVVSAVLLILLAPLFLVVALAIKLTTPNLPIFYRWCVVGQNGVEFTGYKLTTMYADADEQKNRLVERNEMNGPVFKMKNDPRITSLGRFLRKYSINELPQLWSVLKGDMSLVGPRPAFRHELERYEFWHKRKLSIRPGITCLWQIRGRNKINDFDDWVKMDLEYIDNWSLWLDFKILFRTAWVVLAGTGS